MRNNIRPVFLAGATVVALCFVYARTTKPGSIQIDSGHRVVMGTFSRVVVIANSERTAKRCIEAAFEMQQRIEELMSYHRDDSELSRINRDAADRPVPTNPLMFEVLEKSVAFSKLSDGAFDVTVGPLVDLWKAAGEANAPPTEEALAGARAKVGYGKLVLDEKNMTVRFAVQGMRIDLGGIGKGYAVDKSVEAMKQRGAIGGMVDLGGNIRCFGRPPRGQETWRVGLQDPNVAPEDVDNSRILLVLSITDQSVATSGDYRRFMNVQGQKQSHVIDATSGKGANRLVSDTVIASDATTADALSTAVNVLGPQEGLALIERLPNVEAILIPADKDAHPIFSSGAGAYVE
ncbi:MAG: FAD:protein FMN transferase [Sedimentisphaerales bacterium]|nr:FAD:protein FMN transferase [Sedimentisphaerales bacterium]